MATQSKLAVILHADVAGSTTLVQKDDQLAHERIQTAFRVFSRSVEAYGGNVTELRGDAILAEFARGSDAVLAALSAQEANAKTNDELDDDIRPVLRIGIALGEVIYADDTVTGAGVVLAQRLEQMARPGGICVSAAIREAVPTRLPFDYEDLGLQEAKGFDHLVQTFAITPRPGHPVPPPPKGFITTKIKSRNRWFSVAIGAIALLIVGIWLGSQVYRMGNSHLPLTIPDKPSIAILPFANMSGEPNREYFSDGFSEDIITELSRFQDLFVIARNSSFKFKGQKIDIRQIGLDLGVRYVLEGTVRKVGDKLLINSQLIDATNGTYIWAKRYDVGTKELFAVQDDVTQEIVSTLVSKVRSTEMIRANRKQESDLTAYEYVLQAKDLLYNQRTEENTIRARELAKKSIQLDPHYAPAHAVLSYTYYRGFVLQWDPPEALALAHESAQKAIELDNTLAEAYDVLARVYSRQRQHDDSISMLDRALSLNPNRAETYGSLANTLTFAGRPREAVGAVQKAMRLDPFYRFQFDMYLGRALYFAKQYKEALLPLKTCAIRSPNFQACFMYLAPLYAELGRAKDARNTVARLLELAPGFTIETSVKNHLPYVPEAMNHYVQGLLKAGVPER